jgi:uncharacterized protein YjbI with pentapeptide repeats
MFDDTKQREVLPINDPENGRHNRVHEEINGVKVEVRGGKGAPRFVGSSFSDCEIRLHSSGNVTPVSFRKCSFEDCLIWPAKKHTFATWDANFAGCQFKGKYEGRFSGNLTNCDLRSATLLSTQFLATDDGTNQWPAFPHIVIKDIETNIADWRATPATAEISVADVGPRITAPIIVLYLPHLVDDPELLWSSVREKNYVFAEGR